MGASGISTRDVNWLASQSLARTIGQASFSEIGTEISETVELSIGRDGRLLRCGNAKLVMKVSY
jgi:hypothetical protein